MALDMLVDSTQLDSALSSVADAIRAKGGTSAQLAFPAGFVSAVQAIPTGGGSSSENDVIGRTLSGIYSNQTIEVVGTQGLSYISGMTGVDLPNLISVGENGMRNTGLQSIHLEKLEILIGTYSFAYNSSLTTFVAPALAMSTTPTHTFYNDTALTGFDVGGSSIRLGNEVFHSCSALTTMIFRKSDGLVTLASTGAFNGSRFASGGAGGTIYIPKVLYDHLGDGTALDYKNATNWSTIDARGVITWAKIEGSQYETQYVDGTPISTS